MSPTSRGRRTKPGRKRQDRRAPAPDFDGIADDIVRDVGRDLLAAGTAIDAEIAVSQALGMWAGADLVGADPEVVIGGAVVRAAQRRGDAAGLAVLRGFEALGTDRQRLRAGTAAAELARRGVPEPPWRLDPPQLTGCWSYGDVYGDQTSVLVAFRRGGEPHGLVVLVDHALGGIAKDAFLIIDPDAALASIRQGSEAELVLVRDHDPAGARVLVEEAVRRTDETGDPRVDEDFGRHRTLALARLRTLPSGGRIKWPEPVDRRGADALVAEFLAAPEAAGLPDRAVAARCAGLIVEHGVEVEGGNPRRVSPLKTELFLLDWLPTVQLDEAERAAVPAVTAAWVRWAGADLPERARAELDEAAERFGREFLEDEAAHLADSYLADVDLDLVGPDEVEEIITRRAFAAPALDLAGSLDPADPDDRELAARAEHPKYADALDDPDELVDGVPRLHVALHQTVANQLWEDQPPEVWAAARRLLDQGHERHDVLHALTHMMSRHLHGALGGGRFDLDAYRRDLDAMGAPARRSRGCATSTGARGRRLQIKVSLRRVKPPIWRRLVVPASLTLDRLHTVLQQAMGWTDSHLHAFEADGVRYAVPDPDDWVPVRDERRTKLSTVLREPGDRLRYEYDFGEGWEHDVVVEEVVAPAPAGEPAVRCLAGRRACPPEDCGGPWGYADVLDALAQPDDPEHADRLAWLGPYDPAAFDRDEVDERLAQL